MKSMDSEYRTKMTEYTRLLLDSMTMDQLHILLQFLATTDVKAYPTVMSYVIRKLDNMLTEQDNYYDKISKEI